MNKLYLSDEHLTSESGGLRAFFNICELWGLSHEQSLALLGVARVPQNYRDETSADLSELSADSIKRISYVLGIYVNLQLLLPDLMAADRWMSAKNEAAIFNGESALEKILAGGIHDLEQVHQYLYALSVGN